MKIHDPAMLFKDDQARADWERNVQANEDPYGNAVCRFCSEWATRMERELAKGKALNDIAERCSTEADNEGITGFMYGCAVSILSHCWKFGEELRCWSNLREQIGTEGEQANKTGGVLNPALLRIST